MSGPVAGPVLAGPQVVTAEGTGDPDTVPRVEVRFTIDESEPVFAGHYPGFPIFPGVCVVDCVHRAALATAPGPGLGLAALESARFTGPVFPGDVLTVAADWKQVRGGWTYAATASTGRGGSAVVRLRYRQEGSL